MCAIFHLKSSSKLESPQHIFFFFLEKNVTLQCWHLL